MSKNSRGSLHESPPSGDKDAPDMTGDIRLPDGRVYALRGWRSASATTGGLLIILEASERKGPAGRQAK